MGLNHVFFSHALTKSCLTKGIKLDLSTVRTLLGSLGNPHRRYPSIHLAGTNGKGSTSTLIYQMLNAHGLKAGLFNSPHVFDIEERFNGISRHPDPDEVISILELVQEALGTLEREGVSCPLTFFELTAVFAFVWFERLGVDYAVIETGLGGRLDATNVVDARQVLITSIGLDHQQYLGNSLRGIAKEKAGIIRPFSRVILGHMDKEIREFFQHEVPCATVCAFGQEFNVQCQQSRFSYQSDGFLNGLSWQHDDLPSYQKYNLGMALRQIEHLESDVPWQENQISQVLTHFRLKGRFSTLRKHPPVICDVAHNPQGMHLLLESLKDKYAGTAWQVICGFSLDKNIMEMLALLKTFSDTVIFVPYTGERSANPKDFSMEGVQGMNSLSEAMKKVGDIQKPLLICGSFYLAEEVYALMQENQSKQD